MQNLRIYNANLKIYIEDELTALIMRDGDYI